MYYFIFIWSFINFYFYLIVNFYLFIKSVMKYNLKITSTIHFFKKVSTFLTFYEIIFIPECVAIHTFISYNDNNNNTNNIKTFTFNLN